MAGGGRRNGRAAARKVASLEGECGRLVALARQRLEDLRFFRDLSAWIAGTMPLDRLLARICRSLAALIDVPQCFIVLLDAEGRALEGVASTAPFARYLPGIRIPLATKRSLAVRAFKTRRSFTVYDAKKDPRANPRFVRLFKATSLLAVPLVARGRSLGTVMLAESRRLRAFTGEEVARAQTVANQAALGIEAALGHSEAVAARERAEALLETVRQCAAGGDIEEVLLRVARRTLALTSGVRCTVFVADPTVTRIAHIVDLGSPDAVRRRLEGLRGALIDDFPAGRRVARARRAIVFRDIGREGGISPELARHLEVRACALAPVRAHGRFVAALAIVYALEATCVPREDVALVEGVAYQVALAIASARAFEEIRRQRAALDGLTARMIGSQEEERRRIARELHDGVSQTLTAAKFEFERLARRPAPNGEDLRRAANLIGDAIGEVRRLCMDLRPSQLDHLGLASTLGWYGKSFAKRTGIEVDVAIPEEAAALPPAVEINLYRIVQEALSNAAGHSGAKRVSVRLRVRGRRLLLTLKDDGRGFDPSAIAVGEDRAMGLLAMKERAALLGGELRLRARPGRGTTIDIAVTLPAAAPAGGDAARGAPPRSP